MYRANQELGAAARFGMPRDGQRPSMFNVGSRSAGSTRTANRYESTSCPPGQSVVKRDREHRAPKFIGDKNYTDVIYCKPTPVAAPVQQAPAPAPNINVQTTVNPTLQTDISPNIAPIFSQMQDSPGSTQAATTAQVKPGGMTAQPGGTGGDSGAAMLEFMKMQAQLDRERRQAESAERERERQAQAARDADFRERQFAAQQDAESRREAQRQEQLRLQREADDARAKRQADIDAEWRAQNEAQQAAYQAALENQPQAQPTQFISTPSVMPGRQMVDPELDTIVIDKGLPMEETGPNWLLIGGGVLLAGGVYYLSTRKGKRK